MDSSSLLAANGGGGGGGIAAVAKRIQERAVQLAHEQEALKRVEEEKVQMQNSHAVETKQARQVRQQYLKSVLQLTMVELEYCQVQDQIATCKSKTETLQQETSDILEQLQSQQAEWESSVQETLVQHKVRQELYEKHLRGAIDAHHQAVAKRQKLLETVQRLTQQSEQDHANTLKEQQRVQADMMRMTEAEHEINQQVDTLALQVREALGKVRAPIRWNSCLCFVVSFLFLIVFLFLYCSERNYGLSCGKHSRRTRTATTKRKIWRTYTEI